ncbi:MAG: recombinase family protein [Chloroflexi bacterium]|nr:recombinase family protein [Chloroflexota bacterium]
MRAVGYVRCSTSEQATEGYGLDAQRQAIEAYCRAQGWELCEVYSDGGRSGKTVEGREALACLLQDAQSGAFERVVFLRLDRLGRSLRDLLRVCDELEAAGVGVVSVREAIDTGTAAGRMMRSILGSLAEFERETIVDRIKDGLAQKARQGELLGPLPLGYRRDEEGAVVTDPVTAPLVRDAFERYATGRHSLRDMTRWAADVGLQSTAGNLLDRLSIRKLLTSIAYAGQVAYHERQGGGVVATGKHPAIVDAALFAEVQETLTRRRRSVGPQKPFGREPYPLSGIAVCGYDAAPMLGLRASSDRQRYVRCSTAQRQGRDACQQPMVRAEVLEGQVAAYVGGMRLPPEYLGEVVAELRRRREQRVGIDPSEAGRLERQIERWRRLFVLGEIDEEHYQREARPLRRRLAEIDRPREVLDVEQAVAYLRDVGALWAESSRQLQREFVREVFDRMVVEGQEISSITPKPLYTPLFVLDRRERFDGDFCSLAPRAGLEPAT